MTDSQRCLIFAPTGDDAGLINEALAQAGLASRICADLEQLCAELGQGAATVIIAQAALDEQASQRIRTCLAQEPAWSALPFVLLIGRTHDPALEENIIDLLGPQASLLLLGCPCHAATLVSAVRSALHDRQHQYQLRSLLEQLDAKTLDLERSNAELQRFAFAAAHDLKAPLRLITMYLDLIEEQIMGSLDDQVQDSFGQVIDGCTRMRGLIDALLEFARVGATEPDVTEFPLEEALTEALDIHGPAIEEARPAITIGDLPNVRGDRSLLLLLFQNLIGNAIKYSSPERRLEIAIAAADHDHRRWRITITDTGLGVAPEDAERIFMAFERCHGSDASAGHGIGLSTCTRIVELHGGRIWIEPTNGPGTCFAFTLAKTDRSA